MFAILFCCKEDIVKHFYGENFKIVVRILYRGCVALLLCDKETETMLHVNFKKWEL